ncbi:hypothetical protein FQN57_006491 [Myotisia sp. PD_48]|nr:hypothetical protein FQN57_006491 [Myotisia sp. PD_48]
MPYKALPPAEVDCKWWKKGYCFRGTKCYFRHDEALAGVDAIVNFKPEPNSDSNGQSTDSPNNAVSEEDKEKCAICLEVPETYGLLIKCDHVFCLACIRNWRATKNPDEDDDDITSGGDSSLSTKTCPLCRKRSEFVVPSSVLPTPPARVAASNDPTESKSQTPIETATSTTVTTVAPVASIHNPMKEQIIDEYLAHLRRIPCRYFEEGVKRWRGVRVRNPWAQFRPICYFGNDCHYAHIHPTTKEQYIFSDAELLSLQLMRDRRRGVRGDYEYDSLSETDHETDRLLAFRMFTNALLLHVPDLDRNGDAEITRSLADFANMFDLPVGDVWRLEPQVFSSLFAHSPFCGCESNDGDDDDNDDDEWEDADDDDYDEDEDEDEDIEVDDDDDDDDFGVAGVF